MIDVHMDRSTQEDVSPRVLIAEDNEGFAYIVRDMLTRQARESFRVLEAHTLSEAVRLVHREAVDVILLDLGLPDSRRMNTFSRMRAAAPHTPIIILTVLDDDDVAMQAVRQGAQDYLVKDHVDPDLLTRTIRYAIERSHFQKELHQLSARLLHLQDEERRRVARALHDATGQNLAALSMNLSALKEHEASMHPDAREILEESQECLAACSSDVRTMSYLLHPPLLDEIGLPGAVRDYADGFAERSGIRVDLEIPASLSRLPQDVETALFRVMQECLTNIHRHARSPTASIRFERTPGSVAIEVSDTGRGLDSQDTPDVARSRRPGVGLAGMRERAAQLGGRLDVESSSGGTRVQMVLPLKEDSDAT